MNSYTRRTHCKLLSLLMLLGFGLCYSSCTDPETTDSTRFALYYPDVINIGPSMVAEIPQPTYIGNKPSNFEIIDIKFEGQSIETDGFVIDENTGRIQIVNTQDFSIGTYTLTVSCDSNNKHYILEDIVSINMMKPIPDGIRVEPDFIQVDYKELVANSGRQDIKFYNKLIYYILYNI